ncbi:MAG: hypothetical protein AAF583_05520 [Pseudomonadota bacterium]
MMIRNTLAFCGALTAIAFNTIAPVQAQAQGTPDVSQICTDYVRNLSLDVGRLLANENEAERFQRSYHLALRIQMLNAACSETPDVNRYADQTEAIMQEFQTELQTDGDQRCRAIVSDLVQKLNANAKLMSAENEYFNTTITVLKNLSEQLNQSCPASVQMEIAHFDRLLITQEGAAAAWPACEWTRAEFKVRYGQFLTRIIDPSLDPVVVARNTVSPVMKRLRDDCSFDPNWTTDIDKTMSGIDRMIGERLPDVRTACVAAMEELDGRLNAIQKRNAEYVPGCEAIGDLNQSNAEDNLAIQRTLDTICRLYPYAVSEYQERYQRAQRLAEELYAEDATMRSRIQQGDPNAIQCTASAD